MVDWKRVAEILDPIDRTIFLSVECGTIEEAKRSLPFLQNTLKDWVVD